MALTILRAIDDKGHEIRFEPEKDSYRVYIAIDDESYEFVPPPAYIHFAVAQTVKAMVGLDVTNCTEAQEGHIDLQVRDRIVRARVLVQPNRFGQKVVFQWQAAS